MGKIPWRMKNDNPFQYFLPGKFYRQSSLVGYSPWGHKELDVTEYAHAKFLTFNFPVTEFPLLIAFINLLWVMEALEKILKTMDLLFHQKCLHALKPTLAI